MKPFAIFSFDNTLSLLKSWIQAQPKGGRGIPKQMATELNVSTVLISQIISGTRSLKIDHAFKLAKFMTLDEAETNYFLLLVQFDNAENKEYQRYLKTKIVAAQTETLEVKNRVSKDMQLTEEVKAIFYSHWHYSAIRLLTDIPGFQSPRQIANAMQVSLERVNDVLQFLVKNGMCKREAGQFKMAIQSTHLESESPWIFSRQLQWRQKAMQSMEEPSKESLYYTGPMVLSVKDQKWVRERLVELIREISERARNSSSEVPACLVIDWFSFLRS
jgi:uncharacterized protein (TIGR02147 family)